jgi:hypothetical protein
VLPQRLIDSRADPWHNAVVGFVVLGVSRLFAGDIYGVVAFVFAAVTIYFAGWRTAIMLQVEGDQVIWRAPLRGGRVSLAAAQSGMVRRRSNTWLIRTPDGQRVYVLKGSGLRAFLQRWHIGAVDSRT